MKVMIDLNVILDIVMNRSEFVHDSLTVCNRLNKSESCVSAHLVTTAAYLTRRLGADVQEATLSFLLENFTIVPCDEGSLAVARQLKFPDYEDAVVAANAQKANCRYIITRNKRDFANSPVPALTPGEYLAL